MQCNEKSILVIMNPKQTNNPQESTFWFRILNSLTAVKIFFKDNRGFAYFVRLDVDVWERFEAAWRMQKPHLVRKISENGQSMLNVQLNIFEFFEILQAFCKKLNHFICTIDLLWHEDYNDFRKLLEQEFNHQFKYVYQFVGFWHFLGNEESSVLYLRRISMTKTYYKRWTANISYWE